MTQMGSLSFYGNINVWASPTIWRGGQTQFNTFWLATFNTPPAEEQLRDPSVYIRSLT